MTRTILVDATNQFLRNYAVRPTLNREGERIGGVYGLLDSLRYFCRLLEPTRMILCWDGSGGSMKRRKILPEYKEGRKAVNPARINSNYEHESDDPKENLRYQRIRLAEYLSHLPITELCFDDTEADDIIAYLAGLYQDEIVIVSDDKDFLQLLNKNTIVFRPTTKVIWTIKTLVQEFSIYPHNFAVAKAVVGDPGDNVKGVYRVGFPTFVKDFPFISNEPEVTITDLMDYAREHVQDKKGNKYQKYIDAEKTIKTNYKVVQLRDPIIGNSNIDLIHRGLDKSVSLNASAMRSKFMIDDIRTLGDPFFFKFKEMLFRGKTNGRTKV